MNALLPILLVAFLGIMFMASRRQKKEARAVSAMQDALAPGDVVMTTSGLHGTIDDLDDDTVDLEIAPGVITTWNRLAIRSLVTADVVDDDLEDATDDHLDDDPHHELEPTVTVDDQPVAGALAPAAPSLRKD